MVNMNANPFDSMPFNGHSIHCALPWCLLFSACQHCKCISTRKVEKVNIHMNVSNFLNSITRKSNKHALYCLITNGYPYFFVVFFFGIHRMQWFNVIFICIVYVLWYDTRHHLFYHVRWNKTGFMPTRWSAAPNIPQPQKPQSFWRYHTQAINCIQVKIIHTIWIVQNR